MLVGTRSGGYDVLRVLSPEECIESDQVLLEAIREALSERTDNGYPKNNRLANVLWKVLQLWEDPRN